MKDTFSIRMTMVTQCEYDYANVTPTGFNRYMIRVSTQISPRWGFIFYDTYSILSQQSVKDTSDNYPKPTFLSSCKSENPENPDADNFPLDRIPKMCYTKTRKTSTGGP